MVFILKLKLSVLYQIFLKLFKSAMCFKLTVTYIIIQNYKTGTVYLEIQTSIVCLRHVKYYGFLPVLIPCLILFIIIGKIRFIFNYFVVVT